MQKAVIRKLFLISLSDVNALGNNIRALYFSEMCSL